MKYYRLSTISILVLSIALLFTCKPDNEFPRGSIHLTFAHTVDGQDLVLGDKAYVNAAGNQFRVEKLKYYVSNIQLNRKDGSFFSVPDGYFLVEESNISQRRTVELSGIPVGTYTSLSFAVGVDSARNFSTQLVGDLNPNNDMAWNWVSGYKFFLIEGRYTTNTQVTDALVYHIGGNTSYRTVTLHAQAGSFPVNGSKVTEVNIQANINRIFNTTTLIDLNEISAVMEPGTEANKIADNYTAGMFSIKRIQTK